jgi:MerR family transcriptional regulator/heat shock protein HspR
MTTSEPETYSLDEAGRILGVSAAEIESYIAEGLVEPRRNPAGEVFLARVEMRRLWSIVTLSRDLGINLPGVAAVLQLREQFERMRGDLATLVEIVERELGPDVWDRLWPEGRPRPSVHVSVNGSTDLEGAGPAGPGPEKASPEA